MIEDLVDTDDLRKNETNKLRFMAMKWMLEFL